MIKNVIKNFGFYFAWILASAGVLGSLYFSEIRHLEPCHLCWYQRMVLFPLALMLGIASYRGDLNIISYALPFSLIGLLLALFQTTIQEIPSFNPIALCGAGPSCTSKIDIGLGFLSIPMLSVIDFLAITMLLIGAKKYCLHKK